MKARTLIVAVVGALVWHAPASAQGSIDERLANTERRVKYLEERVAAQDRVIVEKDRELGKLTKQEDAWFNTLEIGGFVELETAYESPYSGDSTTDAAVATVELGVAARIHDWVAGEVVLLYGEDDTGLEVDVAAVTAGPLDGSWSVTGGQYYLPFGTFETNLISDPLTLEVGETRETALLLRVSSGGFHGSVFGFNGNNNRGGDDRIASFGTAVGYAAEFGDTELGLDLSYINDIGDSDSLQDAIADALGSNDVADRVPGWAASAKLRYGGVSLIGEYLTSLGDFQVGEVAFGGRGARPSSWMIEAAYTFGLAGKEATVAVGYQGTEEALALELPEARILIGLSVQVVDGVALAVEWATDNDYGVTEGGSGENANTVTVQVAAEF